MLVLVVRGWRGLPSTRDVKAQASSGHALGSSPHRSGTCRDAAYRARVRVSASPPAALAQLGPSMALAYPVTTTDALRLSDFGAPERIHAPPLLRLPYSSSGTVTLTCRS